MSLTRNREISLDRALEQSSTRKFQSEMVSTMSITLKIFLTLFFLINFTDGANIKNYLKIRNKILEVEKSEAFGASLELKGSEIQANKCLMGAKLKELDEGFLDSSKFLPAKNFLNAREEIDKSEVYKIIKKMPKGSVFHAHSTALASIEYIVKNLTHQPYLYICKLDEYEVRFHFFIEEPTNNECDWKLVADLRSKGVLNDTIIEKHLEALTDVAAKVNVDSVWKTFEEIFNCLKGLINYRLNFEKYLYQALKELHDDNVMYIEIRVAGFSLYELNGTVLDPVSSVRLFKTTIDSFTKDHPNFLGAKLIYSPHRKCCNETFDHYVETYREIKSAFPDFVVGFDLIGQEEKGDLLIELAEKLIDLGKDTQFFFHAGETNWYGHATDENLVDALLLNTKRIGHGFALLKHPKLMELVKMMNVTIELNPISNQVLKLVKDMRNHPAAYFFANNFPIVVSNDDPSFWGAKGLSYDFYEAFVGIMSRHADLRALKQLAINSIVYSCMNDEEKKHAFDVWRKSWDKFVKYLAEEHKCVCF